jgi:hypothetical protein
VLEKCWRWKICFFLFGHNVHPKLMNNILLIAALGVILSR